MLPCNQGRHLISKRKAKGEAESDEQGVAAEGLAEVPVHMANTEGSSTSKVLTDTLHMRSVYIDVHAQCTAHVNAHAHGQIHKTYMTDVLTHMNTHVHVHMHVHVPCTVVMVVLLFIQGNRPSMQWTRSSAAATTSCLVVANTIPLVCNGPCPGYNGLCPGCPLCVFSSALPLGTCMCMW